MVLANLLLSFCMPSYNPKHYAIVYNVLYASNFTYFVLYQRLNWTKVKKKTFL